MRLIFGKTFGHAEPYTIIMCDEDMRIKLDHMVPRCHQTSRGNLGLSYNDSSSVIGILIDTTIRWVDFAESKS